MRIKEYYDFRIPTWAICPIVNGDVSGISEEDEKKLDNFLSSIPSGGAWEFGNIDENKSFSYYNDIDNLGNDVIEAKYTIFEK